MKRIFLFLGILITAAVSAQTSDNPYDKMFDPHDGLRRVEYNGKFGYINEKGNEVIPLQYEVAHDFYNGLAEVGFTNKRRGYINTKGNVVIPLEYEQFLYGFQNGFQPAKKDGKWGMLNEKGKIVVPHEYDYMQYYYEGLALVNKKDGTGKRYGFVDQQGKVAIPLKYTNANFFNEGLAPVQENNLYGFIDTKGRTAIPIKYQEVLYFNEGLAPVKVGYKWGYIDQKNKMVIPAQYRSARIFENGEAEVKLGEDAYFINKNGQRLKKGKWLMLFTKGYNLGEQWWVRKEQYPQEEVTKKYQQGFRLSEIVWNRHEPELFIVMSKNTGISWQGNFSYNYEFDKMWERLKEHYKEGRCILHLSFASNGKWTFMPAKLGRNNETALHSKSFPWQSVEKHWKSGRYIARMEYGDRWVVVMRNERYTHQIVKVYSSDKWDQNDVDAMFRKGYAITDVAKQDGHYYVVYTKGTGIKDQLLLWSEELPLREIKSYWNKGWKTYRTFYIPRYSTMDDNLFDLLD